MLTYHFVWKENLCLTPACADRLYLNSHPGDYRHNPCRDDHQPTFPSQVVNSMESLYTWCSRISIVKMRISGENAEIRQTIESYVVKLMVCFYLPASSFSLGAHYHFGADGPGDYSCKYQ